MRIERASGFPALGQPGLYWLGQAGFWFETGQSRILIDPYLSDSLSKKYAGTKNPHTRMMPPPIAVDDLPRPDLVLVTHAHTDHMDPETLGPLSERFPDLNFVVPAAAAEAAHQRIGASANLIFVDAGQVLSLQPGMDITVFPAAHERLDRDAHGHHVFLGYGIDANGMKVYHSGDCIPFPELDALIAAFGPDILLLPVNGRDEERLAAGVPGNFTLSEARALAADYGFLVPHHFGMFNFNTLDPKIIDAAVNDGNSGADILLPLAGEYLKIFASSSEIENDPVSTRYIR